MLPSAPTGTIAMFALTWPRDRFVFDVVGSVPPGTSPGVADTNVFCVWATAVMLTITPVTLAVGRHDVGDGRQHGVGAPDRQRQPPVRTERRAAGPTGGDGARPGVEDAARTDRLEPAPLSSASG